MPAPLISPLPTPPSLSDPGSFPTRAQDFLGAFPTLQAEANAQAAFTNDRATVADGAASTATGAASAASGSASSAAGSASAASTSASSAAASAAAAANSLRAVGEPFPLWDHITGCPIPDNSGTAKFIRLTAGLTGPGQYNNGLIGSESVSGSSPDLAATATILVGPMAGQTVALVNTEQAFIRPRTTSGAIQASQNRSHRHQLPEGRDGTFANPGAFIKAGYSNNSGTGTAPTETAMSAEGGDEARPRNRSATFYMRIV